MSNILYLLVIKFYQVLIWLVSPFNHKAKLMIKGRVDLLNRIELTLRENTAPIVWFHCASLGEFEQGRPVMEELKKRYPQYKIFLTFFSPSGYEMRKNYSGADWVFYLPFDSQSNAKKLLTLVKPSLVFFVKYEFWYYYLTELKKRNTPTYLISGLFREDQSFFKWYGSFFRKTLFCFSHIFLQNKKSFDLLTSISISEKSISGDTRYDRVRAQLNMVIPLPMIESFSKFHKVLIGGSVWEKDMELLITLINQKRNGIRFIIAPHEIDKEQISNWRNQIQVPSSLYSEIQNNTTLDPAINVIFVDSIGLLASIYRYGNFAHVGGAFGKGLHNILEAATFGMPISFGPNIKKFPEAQALIDAGCAKSVSNTEEFLEFVNIAFEDSKNSTLSEISRKFVLQNIGATEHIFNHLKPIMK